MTAEPTALIPKRRPLTRENKSITLQEAEQARASWMLHQLPSASGGEKTGELGWLVTYSAARHPSIYRFPSLAQDFCLCPKRG